MGTQTPTACLESSLHFGIHEHLFILQIWRDMERMIKTHSDITKAGTRFSVKLFSKTNFQFH
jgi:hypothetical protein